MSAKKKVQFDKASATSKVRLERIKKIYEDCGWKRGDLSARERWIVKKIAIKHLGLLEYMAHFIYAAYKTQCKQLLFD